MIDYPKSHLEWCYAQSSRELDNELGVKELALWDNTLADGLPLEDGLHEF